MLQWRCQAGETVLKRLGFQVERRGIRTIARGILPRAIVKPEIINDRKAMVEHPFGTMKNGIGYQHFLNCVIISTSAEMSFSILAYNLKRVLNIVDFKKLMTWVA